MNAPFPKPLSVTEDEVTFSRASMDAYIEALEDAEDNAVIDRALAERARLGDEEYRRRCWTMEEVDRMHDAGAHAITVLRDREGWSQRHLAKLAGVNVRYLGEIEAGEKPGSVAAMVAIAKAFRLPLEMVVRSANPG